MLADIIDVTTLWGRDGKLSGQELPFRMSSFVGKLFKNILIVVTSAIPNSSLSTAQMCLRSAISFHFFFTHSSILQLFSLPRRKQMYNFQCSAAYQMDVTSWLPHSLYDTRVKLTLPSVNVNVHLLCWAHNSDLVYLGMQRWQGGPADLGQTWRHSLLAVKFGRLCFLS